MSLDGGLVPPRVILLFSLCFLNEWIACVRVLWLINWWIFSSLNTVASSSSVKVGDEPDSFGRSQASTHEM